MLNVGSRMKKVIRDKGKLGYSNVLKNIRIAGSGWKLLWVRRERMWRFLTTNYQLLTTRLKRLQRKIRPHTKKLATASIAIILAIAMMVGLQPPVPVKALTNSVTWTDQSHWESNSNTTNDATTRSNLVTNNPAGDAKLATTSGWNIMNWSASIYDVHFINSTTGWAVGEGGTILKTTDGGTTWTFQNSGTDYPLYGVHFIDTNTGWAVGINQLVCRTTNGGTTWTVQYPGSIPSYQKVYFVNSTTGWVVGDCYADNIRKTTDGGTTWTSQTSGTSEYLYNLFFIDANTGWVVGNNGTILKTTNGGTSWSTQTSGTYQYLRGVHFVDANTGWAVGGDGTNGIIYKTTNGGTNWTAQTSGTSNSLRGVHFIDANTGWVVGNNGTILKTTNGGTNWTAQTSGATNNFSGVHFVDANTGWVVGNNGTILKTTNGGTSWNTINTSTGPSINKISFVNKTTGWGIASDKIYKTTDSGTSWTEQYNASISIEHLEDIYFKDSLNGWAVGWYNNDGYIVPYVFRTIDGGGTWSTYSLGSDFFSHAVYFIDTNIGWVVGSGGVIRKTTDGGVNWTTQTSGVSYDLYDVKFTDANNGCAVGGGAIRTTNGGTNWSSVNSAGQSICFVNSTTGWTVSGSIIRKTTDGGANWAIQTSGTTKTLQSVHFIDANTGWAVGNSGTILKTTNGGTNWTTESPLIYCNLTDVQAVDTTTVYAKGYNVALKYFNGYLSPGTVGATGTGLRFNAGAGVKNKWTSITSTFDALLFGQAVKYAIRTSNDGTTWNGPYGRDGAAINWTSGSGNYLGKAYNDASTYTDISGVSASQYTEIVVRLESDGSNTPVLHDATLNYNYVNAPDGLSQTDENDANISDGGWTDNTVKAKFDCSGSVSGAITPAIEMASGTPTFTGNPGVPGGASVSYNSPSYSGSAVQGVATVTGLAQGTYFWKARFTDANGVVSPWSSTYMTVKVDKTAPTVNTFNINSNAQYANQTAVTLTIDVTDADSGMPTGVGTEGMRFSNDGSAWSTWEPYATSKAWTIPSGDGDKTVYAQFKDAAGNITGNYTFNETFDTIAYKDVANTTANWDITSGILKLPSGYGSSEKPLSPDSFSTTSSFTYAWGYRFQPLKDGLIVALGRYGDSSNATIKLWTDDGSLLATATVSSSSGWQWIALGTPVQVTAGTYYRVSVWCPTTQWYKTCSFPITRGNINITNRCWVYGSDAFPSNLDTPAINGVPDVEFQPMQYMSPRTGRSLKVNATSGTITKATLTANQTLNGQAVTYEMTANGGANWYLVTPGTEFTFPVAGTDLRWRATLSTTDIYVTSYIQDVSITYTAPSSDTITLDTASPNMGAITAKTDASGSSISASTWQNDNDPYFSWSTPSDVSGISGYYYALDDSTPETGGTWTTSTNVQYAADSVSDGVHTFYVRAKDGAGNMAGTVGSFVIWVDANNPTSSVTITPTWVGPDSYTAATINGTASDGTGSGISKTEITIQRSSDSQYWIGSTWSSLTWLNIGSSSTWSYDIGSANLDDGLTYTVQSKATDVASNEQTSLGSDSFTYDSTYPAVAVTTTGNFGPATWPGKVEGTSSDSGTVKSDISTVEVYIKQGSNYWTGSSWGALTWLAATYASGSWYYNISSSNLQDGLTYTVGARATDGAGNVTTSSTQSVTYDTGPPTCSYIKVNNDNEYTTSSMVSVSTSNDISADVSQMRISNDGTNWTAWESYTSPRSGWSLTGGYGGVNSDGTKTVYVQYQDGVQNISSTYTDTIVLDRVNPTSSISSPASSAQLNAITSTSGSAADTSPGSGVNTVQVAIVRVSDSQYWTGSGWSSETWLATSYLAGSWSKSSGLPANADLTNGSYTIKSKATDNSGREQTTPDSVTITFDKTAPALPTVSSSTHPSQSSWYQASDVSLSWSADDISTGNTGIVGYSYELNQTSDTVPDGTSEGTGISTSYSGKAEGVWYFHVKTLDGAGNWSDAAHFTVRIDQSGPLAAGDGFAATGISDTQISLSFGQYTDSLSGVKEYKIYRSTLASVPASTNQTDPAIEPTSLTYTNLVATIAKDNPSYYNAGTDSYTYTDSSLAMGWFYYRIEAHDNASGANISTYAYAHSKTNYIPQSISMLVNSSSGPITITPSASRTISMSWTTKDADGKDDITITRVVVKRPNNTVLASYDQTSASPTITRSATSDGLGYDCTSSYTFATGLAYGNYTVYTETVDTIGSGSHTVASNSVVAKLTPDKPLSGLSSGETSHQNDLAWSAPNSGLGVSSYRIYRSEVGTLSDIQWQALTPLTTGVTSTTYPDITVLQAVTYYYRVAAVDVSGNEGLMSDMFSHMPPKADAPSKVELQDVSQSDAGNTPYRVFVSFKAVTQGVGGEVPDLTGYRIYRSTDGVWDDSADYESWDNPLIQITNLNQTYFVDTTVTSGANYYYRVRSYDSSFDITNASGMQGLGDLSNAATPASISPASAQVNAPTLMGEPQEFVGADWAVIAWTTNKGAETKIRYRKQGESSWSEETASSGYTNSNHSKYITGLTHSTTYQYTLVCTDQSSNSQTYPVGSTYDFETLSAPSVTVIPSLSSINEQGATVTWQTDSNADSYVIYSTSESDLADANNIDWNAVKLSGQADNLKIHSVVLTGLGEGQTYYLRVKSTDAISKAAVVSPAAGQASLSFVAEDTTAPSITAITVPNKTAKAAVITWNTDDLATSQVEYGTTPSLGAKVPASNPDYNTPTCLGREHRIYLPSLEPGTTYYYRVISVNPSGKSASNYTPLGQGAQGQQGVQGEQGAQADPPEFDTLSGPAISDVKVVSTTSSTATISWDTDTASDSFVEFGTDTSYGESEGKRESVTSHSVTLDGLNSNTTYHFRVNSRGAQSEVLTTGTDDTFKTSASEKDIDVFIIELQVVAVSTNSATVSWTTSVATSTWLDYGTSAAYGTTLGQNDMNTSHTIIISGLSPGATYHFRVRGATADSKSLVGDDHTFVTIALPLISNVKVAKTTYSSATLEWTTNIATDTLVRFGKTSSYEKKQGIQEYVTNHSLTVLGLSDETEYHFSVEAKDALGNVATSQDFTFTTLTDKEGPKISNVLTKITTGRGETSEAMLIITWTTDEPSTSQVEYQVGTPTGHKYMKRTEKDKRLNLTHTEIIDGLNPSVAYHFRVASIDKRGNKSHSRDFTALTPSKQESVLQLIIKSLEESFAWVSKVKAFIISKFGEMKGLFSQVF